MMGPEPVDGITIDISDAQNHLTAPHRTCLAEIARRVLKAEGSARSEISIALVDNATIHAINRDHLDHDVPTDVITFALSDPDDLILAGEIIISTEMAVEMGRRDGIEPWTELILYLIHGLLHLHGYDDLTELGASAMRRREGELLASEGLSHPFSPSDLEEHAPVLERAKWQA